MNARYQFVSDFATRWTARSRVHRQIDTMSSTVTIDDTSSAPESLDLVYDDWEGQFEFLGSSSSNTKTPANHNRRQSKDRSDCDSDDDLNLSLDVSQNGTQQAVLFDEETFLSLNPNDFDDCGPPSELFIEDCTTLLKKSNRDSLLNQNGSGRKFVSAKFHAEELNNIKNRLLADEISNMKGLKPNQNNNNNNIINNANLNNEFAADLCDNLTEQVS